MDVDDDDGTERVEQARGVPRNWRPDDELVSPPSAKSVRPIFFYFYFFCVLLFFNFFLLLPFLFLFINLLLCLLFA